MDDSFYVTYRYTSLRNFVKTMCSPNCFEQCIYSALPSAPEFLRYTMQSVSATPWVAHFAPLKWRKRISEELSLREREMSFKREFSYGISHYPPSFKIAPERFSLPVREKEQQTIDRNFSHYEMSLPFSILTARL